MRRRWERDAAAADAAAAGAGDGSGSDVIGTENGAQGPPYKNLDYDAKQSDIEDQEASGFSPAIVGSAEFDRQLAFDGGQVLYGLKLNGDLVTLPRYAVAGDPSSPLSHGALNGMVPSPRTF